MKLSKGVLGLKFMKKTLIQNQQQETEKKLKKHFKPEIETKPNLTASSSSSSIKIENQTDSVSIAEKTFSSKDCTVIVCPSYLHCERFNYARQSYGGMNPSVEENIRKGVWRMEYEIPGPDDEEDEQNSSSSKLNFQKPATFDMIDSDEGGEPEYKLNIKEEDEEEGEIDSEEEERTAKVFGSIVATLGKKFNKHKKHHQQQPDQQKNDKSSRGRKRPHTQDPQDSYDGASMTKKKKRGFWKNKNKQRNSNNND